MARLSNTTLFAAGLTLAGAGAASAATVAPFALTLGDNGRTLVTVSDLNEPGSLRGTALTTDGTTSIKLSALAYRPQTREFYGYRNGKNQDSVYLIDRNSGIVTEVASTADGVDVDEVGFDFNNVVDAARAVSTAEDNLVFFPNNDPPNITRATDLFYAEGDVNADEDPSIFANAYTNAVPDPETTLQYALDSETDSLTTLANNVGTLMTVGQIAVDGKTLDFTSHGGFDIYSQAEGDNTGYAVLTTAHGTGLYMLDLMAGATGFVNAEFLGATGKEFGPLDGLAVAPIPLPATVWLLGGALAGIAALRRRQSTAA